MLLVSLLWIGHYHIQFVINFFLKMLIQGKKRLLEIQTILPYIYQWLCGCVSESESALPLSVLYIILIFTFILLPRSRPVYTITSDVWAQFSAIHQSRSKIFDFLHCLALHKQISRALCSFHLGDFVFFIQIWTQCGPLCADWLKCEDGHAAVHYMTSSKGWR